MNEQVITDRAEAMFLAPDEWDENAARERVGDDVEDDRGEHEPDERSFLAGRSSDVREDEMGEEDEGEDEYCQHNARHSAASLARRHPARVLTRGVTPFIVTLEATP